MQHPIAISMGDAAGIGPEIIAKAWLLQPQRMRSCFVAGDLACMRAASALVKGLDVYEIHAPEACFSVPPGSFPVLQVGEALAAFQMGQVSAVTGEFAGRCVQWAAQAALTGQIRAMVTAPLHKEALHAAGAPYRQFPGHTEMLQFYAAQYQGISVDDVPVRMMLANEELRTVLVSIHVSLREALERVNLANVLQTIRITHHALFRLMGRAPHIAVAGLNPHAGEGGLFGEEEIQVIAPAIAQARQEGCVVSGPFAPDTVFMRARSSPTRGGEFDVVIAMYHDQGLIPVKYLGVEQGVNVTLGLPLVRTSPDHGTAFDIAGRGIADPASLLAAVRMADILAADTANGSAYTG